jgi:hypothetical protein
MNSNDLARYIESTNSISKPWLLVQLRLEKLKDSKEHLTPEEYAAALEEIHQDLMNLGEWWVGIEAEAFQA